MSSFPSNVYGKCSLCGGASSAESPGDAYSDNRISGTINVPLFWSNYHQSMVCWDHKQLVKDIYDNEKFVETDNELEERRARMGFTKTYVKNTL